MKPAMHRLKSHGNSDFEFNNNQTGPLFGNPVGSAGHSASFPVPDFKEAIVETESPSAPGQFYTRGVRTVAEQNPVPEADGKTIVPVFQFQTRVV